MRKFLIFFTFTITFINCKSSLVKFEKPMNFITVTDKEHCQFVPDLIRSIHNHNKKNAINIIVFDLGILPNQKSDLETKYKVKVYPIEMVHPDLCKKFIVRPHGRKARGWYAWKPVAIYQALQLFDYCLYMDAGMRVTGPSDDIFAAIEQDGYFFIDCGHKINPMTTKYVVKKFNLDTENNWVLNLHGLAAGFQGVSKRIFESYVKPMYLLGHDLRNFEDDGTAPWGFGGARHDQTLFSIYARLLNYKVHSMLDSTNRSNLIIIGNKSVPFKIQNYMRYKTYGDNPHTNDN